MQGTWKLIEVPLTDYVVPVLGTTVTAQVSATAGTFDLTTQGCLRFQYRIGPDGNAANLAIYASGLYIKNRGPAFVIVETDDNKKSFLDKAIPICRRLGIPVTHSVITDKLADTDTNYWKWRDADNLYAEGDDIANHTKTHGLSNSGLDTGTSAQQQVDILDAQDALLARGYTRSARLLAYPYGRFNSDTLAILQANGVQMARVASGTHQANIIDAQWQIKSYPVINTVSVATTLEQVDRAIATGSTISLLFHDIVETAASDANPGTATDYPMRRFEQIMEGLAARIGAGLLIPVTRSEWYAMASQVSVTQ
jgi:peptidoglycan/xylan/chitin deacetylase (PgdA/CDA1 family)